MPELTRLRLQKAAAFDRTDIIENLMRYGSAARLPDREAQMTMRWFMPQPLRRNCPNVQMGKTVLQISPSDRRVHT